MLNQAYIYMYVPGIIIEINWKCFNLGIIQFIESGTSVSPTVLARRSLSYLANGQLQEAIGDAMQAQVVFPQWPVAQYLQAAVLFRLGMKRDAGQALQDGATLEAKMNSRLKHG